MIEVSGRWPLQFDVKFIIPPKEGISLKEANVDFRPRPGDTYIPIDSQVAEGIINKLNSQPDLTSNQIKELSNKYKG
ncbi:hypothetical protein [Clostridium sp. YIM B02551]|uniref:hypothetical protein n=1 Tax=Clostridium sp. YIM B02551 TaxID=2910679 RepID=UPI001EEC89F2|nr:hypothetical protein [Clostridium sp. YIM B02551]